MELKRDETMGKTFRAELDDIIREQQDEILRLSDENRHLRKASQEQRRINGELREENRTLTQMVRAFNADY